jgi:outer membrane protein TolC
MLSIVIARAWLAHALGAVATLTSLLAPAVSGQPLTLDEALQIAEAQQPLLAAQHAGIRAAEEATVAASQLPDPKLKLGLLNVPATGEDAFSLTRDFMTMRMIGVMQEFPRAEKRRLRGALLEIDRRQKSDELVATRRTIRRDVAVSWLDAHFAQRAIGLVEALQRETERQIDLLTIGLKTGKASQADVIAGRIELELLKDRTAQLARQDAIARAELSRWIGEQAQRPVATTAAALPEPAPMDTLTAQLAEHPHLSTFERQVELAETEAELARLGSKPDWNMELSYGIRGSAYSDMLTLQVGVDLPVFQKNRQLRDVAAKLASAQRARALRDDNLREMQAMLRRHHADWRYGLERLERFRGSILPQSASRVEAALAAYRAGRGGLAAVLEARRSQLDLAMQQLILEADTAKAQAQIVYYDQLQESTR